ncbi:NACHT domain-containing protein [Streptomyces sp. NPDC059651]|uniref:NACHT domain-containing protein n=1 Tax=Streptomyces sp. NPDC059651 TaxID=3346897 RepID=UPI0036A1F269
MAELGPAGRDGANRDLKDRLKAALARQGLIQAEIVRKTQLNGESVSKAAVSNALNPEKGPPAATTLRAILNAAGISGTERDELSRLRDRAESPGPTQLEAYLKAAEKAASQHPYPGSLRAPSLPALADVYVRQQARAPAADDLDSPSPGNATANGNQAGPAVPAAEVFRADHDVCVLLGGPGGGKSTLLRAHLADSADGWLGGMTGKTIPVMVSAAALTGTDPPPPLPSVLAKAVTGDLGQVGLLDELTADFFRHPPRAGVSWLVLVDGLDEIPDADARSKVLNMLARSAEAEPGLYRFVVATRPLPATELRTLGQHVPRYELQPFSHDDLLTYATHWFHGLDGPSRHASAFIAGLKRSRLEVLARTPLMASMLCQLYAADPARPLPNSRTRAYESFVRLIYGQNSHKQIASTHDEAIRKLKNRYQIRRDKKAAKQAAQRVRNHLPELIDHLAHERINGSTAPAVEIVASHVQASLPQEVEVEQDLWNSFLSDLLRPTGILAQRGDDFDFLHQTLLEYHAARHATRDEQARSQLLDELKASPNAPAGGRLRPPDLDDSYLGFLLDGLLAPQDRIATETAEYVERVTAVGMEGLPSYLGAESRACKFLTSQVLLRTNLPPGPTAAQLTRFADDTTLFGYYRVGAAEALAGVDPEASAALLARLAGDTTLDEGLMNTNLLDGTARIGAAKALAEVDPEASAALLARLAGDTTLVATSLLQAAKALADVDRESGAAQLAHLAVTSEGWRVEAAKALAEVHPEASAALLARFATDTTDSAFNRTRSAEALAGMDPEASAALLTRLAVDPALDRRDRLYAAQALAGVDREAELAHPARGPRPPLYGVARVRADRVLAGLDKEAGAPLLARFAADATLNYGSRVRAARALAEVDREAGIALLARFAADTTLGVFGITAAARALADVDRETGRALLAWFAADSNLSDDSREYVARVLGEVDRGERYA